MGRAQIQRAEGPRGTLKRPEGHKYKHMTKKELEAQCEALRNENEALRAQINEPGEIGHVRDCIAEMEEEARICESRAKRLRNTSMKEQAAHAEGRAQALREAIKMLS